MSALQRTLLAALTGASLAMLSPPAGAGTLGTPGARLVCACTGDTEVCGDLFGDALGLCGDYKQGNKSACQVLSGQPWVCNNKNGPSDADDRICGSHSIKLEIVANLEGPGNWEIGGEIKGELAYEVLVKERKTCSADAKYPEPDGEAGAFVSEAGVIKMMINLSLNGSMTFTLPGPPPLKVTVGANAGCTQATNKNVYKEKSTSACEQES